MKPLTLHDVERADLLWRCFECAVEPVVAAISGGRPRCLRTIENVSFFDGQIKRADVLLAECATAIEQGRFTEAELVPAQRWLEQAREFSEVGSSRPPHREPTVVGIPVGSWKPDTDWGAARQGREMIENMYDEASEALLRIIAMPIKVLGADRRVLPDPATCQYEEWKDEAREVEKHIMGLRNELSAGTRAGGDEPAGSGGEGKQESTHSDDFTSVVWFGNRYYFSKGQQAESVMALWDAWDKGGHTLSDKTIANKVGSDNLNFRLDHVFRVKAKKGQGEGRRKLAMHPAWGTMIVRATRGVYRLDAPKKS